MNLVLLEGPLEERWRQAIARLYGPYNAKYADASFVRTLFDENPHRGSFHSFLLDDRGEPAGHYAVIPMDIVVAGERKRAGKGEAFVVRADARRESVAFAGMRPILAGPALQFHLFRHALERGLEVVHMIASGDVALVHRMSGAH